MMDKLEELNKKLTEKEETTIKTTLERLCDIALDGFWDWEIKKDYEYMSPKFWQMFGYDYKTKKHHPSEWQEIIHPDDLEKALEIFQKHVDSKGAFPYWQEVRYKHKDGHWVWVLCRGQVIEWDEDNTPIRMIGSHTDITTLKN